MARRRMNSGKFAENFAKSFSSTMSALARAKYYDSLIDKNKGISPEEMARRLGGSSSSAGTGGSGSARGGDVDMKSVYQSYRNAGFSDNQARAMTAEVGRESGFSSKNIFGSHVDAANGATNVGMISMQGARRVALLDYLKKEGRLDEKGNMIPGQETLDAQARFQRREIETDPAYAKTKREFLDKPDVDPEKAAGVIGRNYIRWRMDDPKYASHNETRQAYLGKITRATRDTTEAAVGNKPVAVTKSDLPPVAGATTTAPATTATTTAPARPAELPMLARSSVSAIPLGTAPAEKPAEVAAEKPAEVAAEKPAEAAVGTSEVTTPAPAPATEPERQSSLEQTDENAKTADALGLGEDPYSVAELPMDFTENIFAAEGGAVPEIEQEAPLEDAIGAALRGVQSEYGLGQERAALPGSDPERQSDMSAFARNEGAMSPQEMKTVLSTVDPEGRMPRGEANTLALQKLYNHYAKTGDEGMAQEAASSFVQGARANSMKLGSLALAAMEQGDMAGAGKALIMSYDQIPDGRTVQGEVDQSGNGTINIVDTRTGKAVQQMQVTPQLLKMVAMKLSDGSEFYSHLSRMAPQKQAAPQMQAARPAYYTGGPVEGEDVDPATDGEDAADAEVARDASLSATPENYSDEADLPAVGAIETSGTGYPGGQAAPAPPEYVDMTGMNTAQRAQATAVNRQRYQAYAQEMQSYRQGEVEARQQRGRLQQDQIRQRGEQRRQEYTSGRDDDRMIFQTAKAKELEASRARAASALSDKQNTQAVERDERSRQNGQTVSGMRADLTEADAKGLAAKYIQGREDSDTPQYKAPDSVTGADPLLEGAIPALTMPPGVNTPQTGEEVQRAVDGAFDREFAASPGQKLKMIRTRDAAQEERELTAAESAANAKRVDRKDFADLDAYIDNKEKGLFTEQDPNDPNKRIYVGDKIAPFQRTAIRNWSRKLASFNQDMAPETAAQTVQDLLVVDADKDGNPIKDRRYKITVDPKTGMGRVVHSNGLIAFNLDRESLKQIGDLRQVKILAVEANKAKADGNRAREAEILKRKQELDARTKKLFGGLPATEEQKANVLGPEATTFGQRFENNTSPDFGALPGITKPFRLVPGYDVDTTRKPF